MPDWEKVVSHRLAQLALDERERQEVIAELAGHLEETYEGLRRTGSPEREAVHHTLSQVTDWSDLQRKIYRAKENTMNSRTRRLWLPSFVTLAASVITLIGFAFLGLKPGPLGSPDQGIWWSHLIGGITSGPYMLNEYTVWLMALPLIGALGARLSIRAGGTVRDIVISGVFPALAWLTILFVVQSFAASLGRGLEAETAPVNVARLMILLVLIPGACLLLGVRMYHAAAKRWTKLAA